MSDPDLTNAVNLLRVELEKFNNALYSIGTDALIVRTTALAAPESIDDWSATLPQMQQQTDPYPLLVPDPATNGINSRRLWARPFGISILMRPSRP